MSKRWAAVALLFMGTPVFAADEISVSDGTVRAVAPGETSTTAYLVVRNPTMYDVYLMSASSDAAEQVRFQKRDDGETSILRAITVPAYGSVRMEPDGVHLLLIGLKRSLTDGERVSLTIQTDRRVELRVEAVVQE